jgi:hypothetical protein
VPRKPRTAQRLCDTESRAAGVSPPWVCTRWSVAHGVRQITCKHVSRTTGGLRPPLLFRLRRPSGEIMTIFAMQKRTCTRAAGVNPPWVLGKRTCKSASAKSRVTAGGVLTNAGGFAVANPRGAYAPRSWCSANVCQRKNDFRDARTHIHKSGGRQPAVGMSNAIAVADAFVQRPASARRWSETTVATATRWISAFRVRIPRTSHGGLTPPALVSGCERFPVKKRFWRCANAHSQERRASARRGTVNRTPCRGNHALFSDHATQEQERRASARRGC